MNFLCQILAHYVIYLGSQLKLRIDTTKEQFILQAAAARWHKEGNFDWLTTPDDLGREVGVNGCDHLPANSLDFFDDSESFDDDCSVLENKSLSSLQDPLMALADLQLLPQPSFKNQIDFSWRQQIPPFRKSFDYWKSKLTLSRPMGSYSPPECSAPVRHGSYGGDYPYCREGRDQFK